MVLEVTGGEAALDFSFDRKGQIRAPSLPRGIELRKAGRDGCHANSSCEQQLNPKRVANTLHST
jgi:hypothetical protein